MFLNIQLIVYNWTYCILEGFYSFIIVILECFFTDKILWLPFDSSILLYQSLFNLKCP